LVIFSLCSAKIALNFGVAPSKSRLMDDCTVPVLFDGLVVLAVPFPFALDGVVASHACAL